MYTYTHTPPIQVFPKYFLHVLVFFSRVLRIEQKVFLSNFFPTSTYGDFLPNGQLMCLPRGGVQNTIHW